MAEDKITDLSFLQDMSMGDKTLVIEMIQLFLDNTPQTLDNIKTLISQKDWNEVAAAIHKFKPNLSYMGMYTAKTLMDELESNARNERDQKVMGQIFERVESQCKQAYGELGQALEKLQNV